jgi:phosphoesterase RecJ-like protein
VDRVLAVLRASQRVCVVGHVRPDGDCIGSQLGLALALQDAGKQVVCWNEDELPRKLAFLDPGRLMRRPRPGCGFDCVVAVDSASYDRLGRVGDCIRRRHTLINIDHHASNTRFGDLNWVLAREPSTGEIVYRLLRRARWPIGPQIANCLFAAISTDTGCFLYPSTRPTTFGIAGELVKRGADLGLIGREIYQSFPLSRVRLLRHVYDHFRLADRNRIAWFWLRQADLARTGAQKSDTEGLIDHIRSIETVVVACVFEEVAPGVVRVSLRSKDGRVDVNRVAGQFGGGGHAAAAGARLHGPPPAVQRRVLAALRQALGALK